MIYSVHINYLKAVVKCLILQGSHQVPAAGRVLTRLLFREIEEGLKLKA